MKPSRKNRQPSIESIERYFQPINRKEQVTCELVQNVQEESKQPLGNRLRPPSNPPNQA